MKITVSLVLSVALLCMACAALAAGNELPAFTSVRDVLDSTDGFLTMLEHEEYTVLILEMGGRYFRIVVLQDDHARELYRAARAEHFSASARKAYEDYAWTLPLSFTEELTDPPKDQAELDGLTGKTVQELYDAGFDPEIILPEAELAAPVRIYLDCGLYRYEFEVTDITSGDPQVMTVISGKYDGFSRAAFEMDFPEKESALP